MKLSVLITAFTISMVQIFAQHYTISDNGSGVKFAIKNFGVTVNGSFKELKGTLLFNPANLPAASITATVAAATIQTGNDSRDNHLRKEDYFNVTKFSLISFATTRITASSAAGSYMLEGTITIKGVTKPVSFPFTATVQGTDYLLEGNFKLNRRDFGVGGSSMILSDNLTVSLSVLAKKSD